MLWVCPCFVDHVYINTISDEIQLTNFKHCDKKFPDKVSYLKHIISQSDKCQYHNACYVFLGLLYPYENSLFWKNRDCSTIIQHYRNITINTSKKQTKTIPSLQILAEKSLDQNTMHIGAPHALLSTSLTKQGDLIF